MSRGVATSTVADTFRDTFPQMQIRTALASFVGAVSIYVVMAACGGEGGSSSSIAADVDGDVDGARSTSSSSGSAGGASSGMTSGSSGMPDGSNIVDALLDALTDPVQEANAAPPDVAVETCNKTYLAGATTVYYAEHAYPGKLVNELSAVRVIVHNPMAFPMPGPYNDLVTTPFLRDGFVAISCGGNAPAYDKVTFVLP